MADRSHGPLHFREPLGALRALPLRAALAVLLVASSGSALAGSGGSGYSILGIGDLRFPGGTRSAGMGYTGLAIPSPAFLNPASAATWYGLDKARVEVGGLYEGINATNGISSRYISRVFFTGGYVALPISPKNGIAFAFGIVPYSNINYDTYGSASSEFPPDTLNYTVHQTGSGFLGKGFFGLSWKPLEPISIGASFDYFVGSLDRSVRQMPVGSSYYGGTVSATARMSGPSGSFSLLLPSFGFVDSALSGLSLGVVVSMRADLRYRGDVTGTYTAVNDTLPDLKGRAVIPPFLGVGIAYTAGRYIIAADYNGQQWEKAEISGSPLEHIRNAQRWGIGVERTGTAEPAASFFNRVSYRIGYTQSTTYYSPNGHGIDEWFVTAGVAVPFVLDNWFAFAFEYGKRGATAFGLVEDTFYRVNFSLNISELWFVTSEEE